MIIYNKEQEETVCDLLLRTLTLSPIAKIAFKEGKLWLPMRCKKKRLFLPEQRFQKQKLLEHLVLLCKHVGISKNTLIIGIDETEPSWGIHLAKTLHTPYARYTKKEKLPSLKGKDVLVMKDILVSGETSANAAIQILQAGGNLQGILSIFTFELQQAKERLEQFSCPQYALAGFTTLVTYGHSFNFFEDEDKEKLERWAKNPEQWSKNYQEKKSY